MAQTYATTKHKWANDQEVAAIAVQEHAKANLTGVVPESTTLPLVDPDSDSSSEDSSSSGSEISMSDVSEASQVVETKSNWGKVKEAGSWKCEVCMVYNSPDQATQCISCESPRPGVEQVKEAPFSFGGAASAQPTEAFSFGAKSTSAETGGFDFTASASTSSGLFGGGGDSSEAAIFDFTGGSSDTNTTTPPSGGFSFGGDTSSSSKPFSFGEPTAAFSFGGAPPKKDVLEEAPKFSFGSPTKVDVESSPAPTKVDVESTQAESTKVVVESPTPSPLKEPIVVDHSTQHWKCSACMTQNDEHALECVTCGDEKQDTEEEASTWKCDACMSANTQEADLCAVCGSEKEENSSDVPIDQVNEVVVPTVLPPPTSPSTTWKCPGCMTKNKQSSVLCSVCECDQPELTPTTTAGVPPSMNTSPHSPRLQAVEPASKPASSPAIPAIRGDSKWKCSACTSMNAMDTQACAVCEMDREVEPTSDLARETWKCAECLAGQNNPDTCVCSNCATTDLQQRLVLFYTRMQPDKLKNVVKVAAKYKGKEEALWDQLRTKYKLEQVDQWDKLDGQASFQLEQASFQQSPSSFANTSALGNALTSPASTGFGNTASTSFGPTSFTKPTSFGSFGSFGGSASFGATSSLGASSSVGASPPVQPAFGAFPQPSFGSSSMFGAKSASSSGPVFGQSSMFGGAASDNQDPASREMTSEEKAKFTDIAQGGGFTSSGKGFAAFGK